MDDEKRYFIRTAAGVQKGPYSLDQMKASIQARTLSSRAEYRIGEDEEWQPIKRLSDEIAGAEAQSRAARVEEATARKMGPLVTPDAQAAGRRSSLLVLVILVPLALGGLWWSRMSRMEALGKPCLLPADCPSGMSCLLEMDDDRNIQAGGYCTLQCTDSSDCNLTMSCGEAIQTDSQGARWDGMIRKSTRMCLKR
jgi:hypothetical protein